jgi:hypothetical protein
MAESVLVMGDEGNEYEQRLLVVLDSEWCCRASRHGDIYLHDLGARNLPQCWVCNAVAVSSRSKLSEQWAF